LAVDSNYRGLQQSDQQTTSIQRERDSLNKLGVEILGPIIHCPLKEMKEIKEKKKENSKYIYKFDGRHNTLSTYPHSRRGWKRVDQQLEEDASLLFHLLCFMSQFLSV